MKVRIVCYEDPEAWILGKFATRMCEQLKEIGVDASLGRTVDEHSDVNHHICYLSYEGWQKGLNSLMVTHVDSVGWVRLLRRQLETADLGVCMSAQTATELIGAGLPANRICYVNPGHDGVIAPRRLRVGSTTRLYEDGRKNEDAFTGILDRLPKDDLHFVIMGAGWEKVVERMAGSGFSVDLHSTFDLQRYRELIPELDYFVYFGNDEGSMGFVDAVAAGVATIVTPQGFHLDVAEGITHAIDTLDDLASTLATIVAKRQRRIARVSEWSWRRYAEKHLDLWQHLSGHDPVRRAGSGAGPGSDGLASLQKRRGGGLLGRARFLTKIVRTSIQRRLKPPTGSDKNYE